MVNSERSTYASLDFREWQAAGTLVLTPKFQRRGVWTAPARSYLIESLLMRMPVPPLYLRITQDEHRKRVIREVIDGQQRISAVLDYMAGKYALSQSVEKSFRGKTFSDLTTGEQKQIEDYSFICEVFKGIEDREVLEIFARLNTYSVKLNAQELRNGKFFGFFKRTAYALAGEHLEFWRINRIFTEMKIARMAEVEITSELMILSMDGLQDKKKSIDAFYAQYDQEFPNRDRIVARFRETIDAVSDVCGDYLADTELRRPPLFYTLYGALYHRMFGLPSCDLPREQGTSRLSPSDREGADRAVRHLSSVISQYEHEAQVPPAYEHFVSACLRQTDNLRPRRVRLEVFYNHAFLLPS